MAKKNKLWIWILIILGIIGLLFFTPFLEIIGLTEPGLCGENSYDYNCVCQPGWMG